MLRSAEIRCPISKNRRKATGNAGQAVSLFLAPTTHRAGPYRRPQSSTDKIYQKKNGLCLPASFELLLINVSQDITTAYVSKLETEIGRIEVEVQSKGFNVNDRLRVLSTSIEELLRRVALIEEKQPASSGAPDPATEEESILCQAPIKTQIGEEIDIGASDTANDRSRFGRKFAR